MKVRLTFNLTDNEERFKELIKNGYDSISFSLLNHNHWGGCPSIQEFGTYTLEKVETEEMRLGTIYES